MPPASRRRQNIFGRFMSRTNLKNWGLAYAGDQSLLRLPRRALLISRTCKAPTPSTPWVRTVCEASRISAAAGEVLIVGAERTPFDVALAVTRRIGGAALVVLDAEPDLTWHDAYEAVLPERRLLVWPNSGRRATDKQKQTEIGQREANGGLPTRDALMGELATCAWALQLRKGGNMETVARALEARCGKVDSSFALSPFRRERAPDKRIALPSVTLASPNWAYLTHYTRGPEGHWPGESRAAYAEWLAFGAPGERRDAYAALLRILAMRRVLGSGRLLPTGEPMVSFTARSPCALSELVRWRCGLQHWTFQPYGLAVKREALQALGARAVDYVGTAELKAWPPSERCFAQKHEPPKIDWSGEAEWRLRGDFCFQSLSDSVIRILVPTAAEAMRVLQDTGLVATAIYE